jgi:GNAT superfamily N-acetyltransferase
MFAGFSQEALVHELLHAPRAAIVPLPDTQISERPGMWQVVTPSLKQGGLNEVICSNLDGDDATIDATLDRAIAIFRQHDLQFRITVCPGATPSDLGQRLQRRGLVPSETLGMVGTTEVPEIDELSGEVTVEEVDLSNVDDFTHVMVEGWQMSPAAADALHRRMLAQPARRSHLFIAKRAGELAGASGYVALERSAQLLGAVTLPDHRGHGVYRALVHARLRHARARGITLATTLARATTSAPILTRRNFHTVCSIWMYLSGPF